VETLGLTVAETAEQLRVHEQTVRALIREGRLRSVRVGRRHVVPVSEVERFLQPQSA
jgi:excisionase family DNA binding protein